MKNSLKGFKGIFEQAEKRMRKLKNKTMEITAVEKKKQN